MGDFLAKNKKRILSTLLIILIFVLVSLASLLLLCKLNIVTFEDGISINADLFDDFITSWYGGALILAIQVIITTLLCFIPGVSMAFILLERALFESVWRAFFISFSGVMLSSLIMYAVGRFGSYRLCRSMLGEKDCQRASELLNHKGAVYFPLMMLFPFFPDDALVMIAGTLRMSLEWFIPSILVGRGIGIATIVFGLGSIPYEKFTTPFHWIIFIALTLAFMAGMFYLAYRFNKFLEKKSKKEDK